MLIHLHSQATTTLSTAEQKPAIGRRNSRPFWRSEPLRLIWVRNPGHRGHSIRTIAGSLSGTSRAVCPGHCGQPVNIGDQHLWVI